jgi:hypothetical protein
MQRRKTHFEQVSIRVAMKVLRQATILASARRSSTPNSARERETVDEFPRPPGKQARKGKI